jgi:hypothetical protein
MNKIVNLKWLLLIILFFTIRVVYPQECVLPGESSGFDDAKMNWMEISTVGKGKSFVVPSLWGESPKLTAHSKVKILDVAGPGVVNLIHGTTFIYGPGYHGFSGNSPGAQSIVIRVYYDNQTRPAIEMPLMDFFGDIQCQSALFSTEYFSKVSQSHNFRLPMPFGEHITIELENPSDENFSAYCEIQWEKVERIPDHCGYLRTDYRFGSFKADSVLELFSLNQAGSIVAHWLQFENEKSGRGELLCEADQQLYLDGDDKPTLNHLGSEDLYGFSWGFHGIQSDGYGAIIKVENINPAGSRVAVLRCRKYDVIRFRNSCRWVLTYANDQAAIKGMGTTPITYRHCVYYYAKDLPYNSY